MSEQEPIEASPAPDEAWDLDAGPDRRAESLIVDVDGFEGPLDLLLLLAREQKVDLGKISILALAEQYLLFVSEARRLRLELAADYLVMAAWLAYLKSRLLLPDPQGEDEPSGEEMAALLAFRLRRLEAMREAAAQMMARNLLGRDIFSRGDPENIEVFTTNEYVDNLHDLLKAYAQRRQTGVKRSLTLRRRPVWTIKDARQAIERLIGSMDAWGRFDEFLADYLAEPETRSTVKASSFTATLELIREGRVEVRQETAFAPLFMRRAAVSAT